MAKNPIKVNLRPAPDLPPLPANTPPAIREFMENVRRWCRDAERAVRELEKSVNSLLP